MAARKNPILKFLASLKLAIIVLLGFVVLMATATFIESLYDTKTGQYYIYRSPIFYGWLVLLAVNLSAVMVDRWPWKVRHAPFLFAHIGILMILFGSLLTYLKGVDGNLMIAEGETATQVEFDENVLYVSDGKTFETALVPWLPPTISLKPNGFTSIPLKKFSVTIDRYITHADQQVRYEAREGTTDSVRKTPAFQLKLKGGPMGGSQDFWLWAGEVSAGSFSLGPASFFLTGEEYLSMFETAPIQGLGRMVLFIQRDGSLGYKIYSSKSKSVKTGKIAAQKIAGSEIDTGWMGMKLWVKEFIPDAVNRSQYIPSRLQYGTQVSGPAVRITSSTGESKWLGLGDQAALLGAGGEKIQAVFSNRTLTLPFGIRLERFQIDHYEGTANPMSYSSTVKVVDGLSNGAKSEPIQISMNFPLEYGSYTFYQSSYIPAEPRPTISIFTVNKDPGRWWKYIGSILVVLGSIWLFARKYIQLRKDKKGVAL